MGLYLYMNGDGGWWDLRWSVPNGFKKKSIGFFENKVGVRFCSCCG